VLPSALEAGRSAVAQRKALLADQQASLDRCEHQFSEATRQLRGVLQNAKANPAQARQVAQAQVDAMVGQVASMGEVAIRLLSEKAGQETTFHAMNVSVLSILLGRALKFDAVQLAHLGLGALLHDIGKLELPDRLRWRDDQAPAVERRLFQGHAAHGVTLGKKMALPSDVLDVIAQHHEHADGTGYPSGLKGEQIKPLARVVGLVNQYDNLCNPGNPAQSLTPHDALALIFARQRDAFDATVLAAFIRMMGVYPPGSVLQLNDERYAIVVSVNSDRPLKPRILIHEPDVPADEALVFDLEQHPDVGIQRAIKPLQLPRAVFDYLSPRKRMCYFFERSLATAGREASP
jgi:putative nucleotidyltransferase with HDIG domain